MAGVVQVWAVVLILLWYIFYEARLFLTSLQAYQNQAQGVCLDGRSMEDQNSARFNVTTEALTWNQRLGPATETPELVCDFPVSVHLCPSDASIEECQTNAVNLPSYQRSRTEKTGVRCWGVLGFYMWGAHPCKDEIWHCTDGLCNGYRKSQRLCASNLRREFYPCFFVPSSDEHPVQEERYAYPLDTGSLVICLFLALAFILSYFRGTFLLTLSSMKLVCGSIKGVGLLCVIVILAITIVLLQRAIFLLLIPGETSYSIWGSPQVADPVSFHFKDLHGVHEKAVAAGFNDFSSLQSALRDFIWVLQVYLAVMLLILGPLFLAAKLYLKRRRPRPEGQEGYQAMEESTQSTQGA